MLLIIVRTFRASIKNFVRNGWLSIAAVTVLFLSLYVISLLYVISVSANSIMKDLQDKANISVYFKVDTSEANILKAKDEVSKYSEVKSVDYVSRDKALENFKGANAGTPAILKSLEIIGNNPLEASLVVRANDPVQYETINGNLSNASFRDDISRVNYEKNKPIIEKFSGNISETKKAWMSVALLFIFISIVITFNTIRITIYTHKHEIEVMRLVGASNTFIRLPFIFEGVIYAVLALILSMLFLFLTLKFAAPQISRAIPPERLSGIFLSNFGLLIGVQFLAGIVLGVVSSMIAVRRYLKI